MTMSLAAIFKRGLKRFLAARGYEIYRRPYLPKGADDFESLRAHWPAWQPRVIFDVGANVGQTVGRLRPLFPTAEIYSFEPVPRSYAELLGKVGRDPHVHPQLLALGGQPGEAWINVHPSSDQSSLITPPGDPKSAALDRCRVQLETAAGFCGRKGITRIDLLKIDVEGYEIPVVQGAASLFAANAIDFIVVEAGLPPDRPRFTPLTELTRSLEPHGFHLVGIYEQYGRRFRQTAEWCNAAFAHERHLTPGSNT
jgi:FkbM family methyltransferase